MRAVVLVDDMLVLDSCQQVPVLQGAQIAEWPIVAIDATFRRKQQPANMTQSAADALLP